MRGRSDDWRHPRCSFQGNHCIIVPTVNHLPVFTKQQSDCQLDSNINNIFQTSPWQICSNTLKGSSCRNLPRVFHSGQFDPVHLTRSRNMKRYWLTEGGERSLLENKVRGAFQSLVVEDTDGHDGKLSLQCPNSGSASFSWQTDCATTVRLDFKRDQQMCPSCPEKRGVQRSDPPWLDLSQDSWRATAPQVALDKSVC